MYLRVIRVTIFVCSFAVVRGGILLVLNPIWYTRYGTPLHGTSAAAAGVFMILAGVAGGVLCIWPAPWRHLGTRDR